MYPFFNVTVTFTDERCLVIRKTYTLFGVQIASTVVVR